jgi:hypothetical protein
MATVDWADQFSPWRMILAQAAHLRWAAHISYLRKIVMLFNFNS